MERYYEIICPKCGNWELHPVNEQRHHIQNFEILEWLNEDLSRLKCNECMVVFIDEWHGGKNKKKDTERQDKYQKLFNYFSQEHGVDLLESDMREVVMLCEEILLQDSRAEGINRLKQYAKQFDELLKEKEVRGGKDGG